MLFYLEKPNRVQALGYVFILVLLISSYLGYRVRKSLKENDVAEIPDLRGCITQAETKEEVLNMIENAKKARIMIACVTCVS
ncbi:MAG: type II toxin-antitoxin system HicB family antitoxin [Syntrophaceticus sp.]|nr:type II toxin-antitoxin system HicB family antitoxin [Syntrophaceticus sp.]